MAISPRRRGILRATAWSVATPVIIVVLVMLAFYAAATIRATEDRHAAAPATGRFVDGGDVEMFIQERGPSAGPAVLFVHGTGAWSELWLETLEALASEGYHAVALDLPPFGFSERPANDSYATPDQARRILAVADSMGLANVTLVGHSFGARATMEAVLTDPARIGRVVLVDPALDFNASERRANPFLSALLAMRPVRDPIVASTFTNPLLTKTFLRTLIHNTSAATDERVEILQRPMVVRDGTREAGLWLRTFLTPESPNRSNHAASYAALPMPIHLIWGAEDTTTPLTRGVELARTIPGAQLSVLDGVGHIPQIEEPAAFQRALLAALAGAD